MIRGEHFSIQIRIRTDYFGLVFVICLFVCLTCWHARCADTSTSSCCCTLSYSSRTWGDDHDQEDEINKKVDDHIPNTSLPSRTSSPGVPSVAKNNFRKWEEPISLLVHLLHRFQTLASPDG